MDKSQVSTAAAAGADDLEDNDGNWNMKGIIELYDVERVGANCRLLDFQNSCRARKCKVSEPLMRRSSWRQSGE